MGIVLNSVVTEEVASQLDMMSQKDMPKRYKLLNLTVEITPRAIIFNWAVKRVGFGQVTFYLDPKGRVKVDDEGMGSEFVRFILKHAFKRYNQGLLKVEEQNKFMFQAFVQAAGIFAK